MRLGNSVWVFGVLAVTLFGCSSDDKELGEGTGGSGGTGNASGSGGKAGSGGQGATGGTGATGATGGSGGTAGSAGSPAGGGAAGAGGVGNDCVKSGGTVATALCCGAGSDFPNTCLIGACGCSPENSKDTQVCQCPSGTCFDGTECTGSGGFGGGGGSGGAAGGGGSGGGGGAAAECESSGGTVITGLCCSSSADFPNTCAVGACGCSPSNSHNVQKCSCPSGKCFDGTHCIAG